MSKKNMKRFLERAAADPALEEKLYKLKEEYGKAVLALACEAGFEVTWEDFADTVQCLNDKDMEAVSGGYHPRLSPESYA